MYTFFEAARPDQSKDYADRERFHRIKGGHVEVAEDEKFIFITI
jgi:hypothetical protein